MEDWEKESDPQQEDWPRVRMPQECVSPTEMRVTPSAVKGGAVAWEDVFNPQQYNPPWFMMQIVDLPVLTWEMFEG